MLTEPCQIEPGNFETEEHFYPRVLNAHIHPLIRNTEGSNEGDTDDGPQVCASPLRLDLDAHRV